MKKPNVFKGDFYFATYSDAVEWATANGWPTDFVRSYGRGWAAFLSADHAQLLTILGGARRPRRRKRPGWPRRPPRPAAAASNFGARDASCRSHFANIVGRLVFGCRAAQPART